MKFTVKKWMLLIINSNKEFVTRGVDISKYFFNTYEEAYNNMIDISKSFAKAKNVDTEKYNAFVECEEYFIQMQIIDCSKEIEIIG